MATLHENILDVKIIFQEIADAIREKLGPDAIGECEGPSTYAEKILLINTDCPEIPSEPDNPDEIVPEIILLNGNTLQINIAKTINVEYRNYDFVNDPDVLDNWLEIKKSAVDGNIYTYDITCTANESESARNTKITFSCVKGTKTAIAVVTVIQSGIVPEFKIETDYERYEIDSDTTTFEIPVRYYYSNFMNIPEVSEEWIAYSKSESGTGDVGLTNVTYYFIINENSGNAREATISFSGTGKDGTNKTHTVTIYQKGKTTTDPTPQSSPMYYGYIPYIKGVSPTDYDKITGDYILQCVEDGTITKVDQATTMGKTSFGVVPKYSLLLIAVPSDSGLVVTKDDARGNKIQFTVEPLSNGDYTTEIDDIAYTLYGEYQNSDIANNKYFYIDKK